MADRYVSQAELRDHLEEQGAYREYDYSKPPGAADILAAIAMAETPSYSNPGYSNYDRQGDLDKVGEKTSNGKYTYGPSVTSFQIRTYQEVTGTGHLPGGSYRDIEWLLAHIGNGCSAARWIAQDWGGYSAWTTYTSGKYRAYLQEFYPPPEATYLVVSGDTFYRIDFKLGLRRGQMQLWNPGVDPRKLYSGLQLKLGYVERQVRPGDTLSGLMRTAGWTGPLGAVHFNQVAAFAGLADPRKIYPNQILRILKPGYVVAS